MGSRWRDLDLQSSAYYYPYTATLAVAVGARRSLHHNNPMHIHRKVSSRPSVEADKGHIVGIFLLFFRHFLLKSCFFCVTDLLVIFRLAFDLQASNMFREVFAFIGFYTVKECVINPLVKGGRQKSNGLSEEFFVLIY